MTKSNAYKYIHMTALPSLFNLYIPKDNGETTELDVVLLHESGIYVFESKNYSEKQRIQIHPHDRSPLLL
mgnify:CR=1 FL=1